jgi:PIN domain nuclease of toxin-antitoxin system
MADADSTPLILDTHSWILLLEGDPDLSDTAFVTRAEEASAAGELYVSAISIAEVALLAAAGRVRFVVPVTTWLQEALETPGLQTVDLDVGVAAEGATLPGEFPGDAADRIIVATARLLGGTLATADRALEEYGAAGYVRVLSLHGRAAQG